MCDGYTNVNKPRNQVLRNQMVYQNGIISWSGRILTQECAIEGC